MGDSSSAERTIDISGSLSEPGRQDDTAPPPHGESPQSIRQNPPEATEKSGTGDISTEAGAGEVRALYEEAMAEPTSQREPSLNTWVDYATVDEEESAVLLARTGLTIPAGTVHVIDSPAVRHILAGHGEGGSLREGESPVTAEEIARVGGIIAGAEEISYAGKTPQGLDAIRYRKWENGSVIVVEEHRTGRNKLAVKTMYKEPASPGLVLTSETLPSRERARRAAEGPAPAGSLLDADLPTDPELYVQDATNPSTDIIRQNPPEATEKTVAEGGGRMAASGPWSLMW